MQRTLQRKKQKNIIYFIKKMYILIKKKVASYRFNTRSLLRNSESTQASKEEDLNELTISRINSNIGTAIYEIAKYLNLLL